MSAESYPDAMSTSANVIAKPGTKPTWRRAVSVLPDPWSLVIIATVLWVAGDIRPTTLQLAVIATLLIALHAVEKAWRRARQRSRAAAGGSGS